MNALGRMDATFGAVFAAVQNTYEYLPLAFPSWNGTAVGYAAPSDRVAHVQVSCPLPPNTHRGRVCVLRVFARVCDCS